MDLTRVPGAADRSSHPATSGRMGLVPGNPQGNWSYPTARLPQGALESRTEACAREPGPAAPPDLVQVGLEPAQCSSF